MSRKRKSRNSIVANLKRLQEKGNRRRVDVERILDLTREKRVPKKSQPPSFPSPALPSSEEQPVA